MYTNSEYTQFLSFIQKVVQQLPIFRGKEIKVISVQN